MKKSYLFILSIFLLSLLSCNDQDVAELEKENETLQNKIHEAEVKISALKAALQVSDEYNDSTLQKYLCSPGFWENNFADLLILDCEDECKREFRNELSSCYTPTPTDVLMCLKSAWKMLEACKKGCVNN